MFEAHKYINMLTSCDLKNHENLKEAFEANSLVQDFSTTNEYRAQKLEQMIQLHIKSCIRHHEHESMKMWIFFPDYRETYSFNKVSDSDGNVECQILFPIREKEKTYFNYVLMDRYHNLITSESVVFDNMGRTVSLNLKDSLISPFILDSAWIEKVQIIDSYRHEESDKIIFKTKFDTNMLPATVKHVWQNSTETKIIDVTVSAEDGIAVSEMAENDPFFSCDMWQIICMDEQGRFILQGGINIR